MAEKGGGGGGFGFTPPTTKKSNLKQPVSKSAAVASKKSKTVTFDSSSDSEGSPVANNNGSSKSGGKGGFFDSPASKGDTGKGGKGGKTGKGWGKSSAPKVNVPIQLDIEKDLPKNAKCLMDCEAEVLLQGIQDQLTMLSRDPMIRLPLAFNKGLEYAKGGSQYKKPQDVRDALEKLRVLNIAESELCLISNVCPDTVDEVYALIPSLKAKRLNTESAIRNILQVLDNLKKCADNGGF